MATINIDVDLEDILWDLSKWDKLKLFTKLLEHLDEKDLRKALRDNARVKPVEFDDNTFSNSLKIIEANRWRLPLESELYILNLANKL